jgi:hypothetical protein
LAPLSRAIAAVDFKHGWQFAVIEAPTAINALIRLSNSMVCCLLSTLETEFVKKRYTPVNKNVPQVCPERLKLPMTT